MTEIDTTPADIAIIAGLADGKGYKQIAYDLGTTYFIVQNRARLAMERLQLRTAAGLVAHALRQGWIK